MVNTYLCAGCGIKNFNVQNVWAERIEFRKGDSHRKDIFTVRYWCDTCQPERAEELRRAQTGQVSLI